MPVSLDGGALAALSICTLVALVHLASLILASARIGRPRDPSTFPEGAPVSLVRPVCGLETFSEETLSRSFRLAYPAYEVIFCVADAGDPVVPLVHRLMESHPEVPSRLLVGDVRISDNPKLNNCVRGWEAARYDWVVLADSNVLMPNDYLQQLQAVWRLDTGLVCSTPIGSHPDGFVAEIECAFLNTLQARWQYTGEALGLGFAQGKSMLWNKPFLEAQGGIRALASEIAEDAAATKLVRTAGRQVHLVASPFRQPLGRRRFKDIWSRQLRWARLRRVTFPLFFAPEIGIGTVLPFAAVAASIGTIGVAAYLAALTASIYACEYGLARRAGWHHSPRLFAAFVARDLMYPVMWIGAWLQSATVWRGNAMDIRTKPAPRLRERASAA